MFKNIHRVFIHLQGVLRGKIQLLSGRSQSCKQVTSDQLERTPEARLPQGPDINMLPAVVDLILYLLPFVSMQLRNARLLLYHKDVKKKKEKNKKIPILLL